MPVSEGDQWDNFFNSFDKGSAHIIIFKTEDYFIKNMQNSLKTQNLYRIGWVIKKRTRKHN